MFMLEDSNRLVEKRVHNFACKLPEEESFRVQMYMAHFTDTRSTQRHPSVPSPEPISMVALDCVEGSTSYKQTRALFIDHNKAKSCALEHAERFELSLDPRFPTFVKSMLRSQVTGGFWLGVPPSFCHAHLPKQDVIIYFVDENQEKYPVKYLVDRTGFSGGWRGFSIAHKLVEGDALVFQLVKHIKFKVYIIRAYDMEEIDGALGLLHLSTPKKQRNLCKRTKIDEKTAKRSRKTLSLAALQQYKEDSDLI